MLKQSFMFSLIIVVLISMTACGSGQMSNTQSNGQMGSSSSVSGNKNASSTNYGSSPHSQGAYTDIQQPITLNVLNKEFSNPQWKTIQDAVKKKYPNLTLNEVKLGKEETLQQLVVNGNVPDVILRASSLTPEITNLNLQTDLAPFIKKYNVDFTNFPSQIVEAGKAFEANHQLIMLPLDLNIQALVYNKDLFDAFGINYPPGDMSYDDLLKLVKKVARNYNGQQIAGYLPQFYDSYSNEMGLTIVDRNNKSMIDTDPGFKSVFQWFQDLFAIPTMQGLQSQNFEKAFFDGQSAMATEWLINFSRALSSNALSFQWGIVSNPHWAQTPQWNSMPDFHAAYVTSTSKNKDVAFLFIDYLCTSADIQTILSRQGIIPAILKDNNVLSQFGADIPALDGHRQQIINVIRKLHYAPMRNINPWDRDKDAIIQPTMEIMKQIETGQIDVNTALKQLAEKENQVLASKAKASQ